MSIASRILLCIVLISVFWGVEEYYFRVVLPPVEATAAIAAVNGGDVARAHLQLVEMWKNWAVGACCLLSVATVLLLFQGPVRKWAVAVSEAEDL